MKTLTTLLHVSSLAKVRGILFMEVIQWTKMLTGDWINKWTIFNQNILILMTITGIQKQKWSFFITQVGIACLSLKFI